ncbi:hypothetical protein Fmac_031499 [Flemingia macrophylla]|uniref:RING-type domain-containing protein n=1 Tax=Flemingia macrophylla TaxID=520843 RepID=A0ABD1L298_9FABA
MDMGSELLSPPTNTTSPPRHRGGFSPPITTRHPSSQTRVFCAAAPSSAVTTHVSSPRTCGKTRALPLFRLESRKGQEQKDGVECAVCLGKFEDLEVLRLLPKCRHTFHVECVDKWLVNHSTCPLCRCRVEPHCDTPTRKPYVEELDVEKGQQDDDVSNENAGTTSSSANYCIVNVSPLQGGGVLQRWSDFQPLYALYLTSDMVTTWKAREGRRSNTCNSSNVRCWRHDEEFLRGHMISKEC